MPSNQPPLGALPARFRRERVLIVGCGDIGLRFARVQQPQQRARLMALTSSPGRCDALRQAGITPIPANLDVPLPLSRFAGWATRVVYLAPPPTQGETDPRLRAFVRALGGRRAPISWVYASTSGVYGDCQGDWVDESRPVAAQTPRAQRRVDAERTMAWVARSRTIRVSVLRVPGIYAPDREGGTPRARLAQGSPVLHANEDVFTNHIHADDLARACLLALWRGATRRTFHICDDSALKMGDYYDAAAALYGLPTPPRVSWAQAQTQLSPMQLSFMAESRRLRNQRMKQELRLRLRYPQVLDGLREG